MNHVLVRLTGLLRASAPLVLALPLVLMPLVGSACASPCGPGEMTGVHDCSLHELTSALPDPSEPPCCMAEFVEGIQYLPSRQRPEEGRTSFPNTVTVQTPLKGADPSFSGTSLEASASSPTLPHAHPLYILHAAFLI
jgi:hypothetical protein